MNISIDDYSKDQTANLRQVFESEGVQEISFPKDAEILAEGCIPLGEELEERFDRWQQGEYGIIRIEGKNHIAVKGNNATIYVTKQAVPDLDVDGDKIDDSEAGYRDLSHRSFFRIERSNAISLEQINVRSNNHTPAHKPGRPEYDWKWEFEHFVRLQDVKDFTIRDCKAQFIWGDGVYISGNETENIKIIDLTVDWNGRQAIAIAEGKNILIDGLKVLNSRRGGVDLEAPLKRQNTDGVVVKNSFINAHLQAFPMAGSGRVDNVLIQNNEHNASGITLCRATNGDIKNNYIFNGNTNLGRGSAYDFVGVNNVLIENETGVRKAGKERLMRLVGCKNVHIRNNDWTSEAGNQLKISLYDMELSEVHLYGNSEAIKLEIDGVLYDPVNTTPVEGIPFEVSDFIKEHYSGKQEEVKPEAPKEMNATPENLKVAYASDKNIRLGWDKVQGAKEYNIVRVYKGKEYYDTTTENELNLIGVQTVSGEMEIRVSADNGTPAILKIQLPYSEEEKPEPTPEPTPEEPKQVTKAQAIESAEKIVAYLKSL
jgi:hypothetical protein